VQNVVEIGTGEVSIRPHWLYDRKKTKKHSGAERWCDFPQLFCISVHRGSSLILQISPRYVHLFEI